MTSLRAPKDTLQKRSQSLSVNPGILFERVKNTHVTHAIINIFLLFRSNKFAMKQPKQDVTKPTLILSNVPKDVLRLIKQH